MHLGRVFISSVFGGMLELRKSAAEAARLVGLEPVETEKHVAQAGSVREALAREIAACDTYVGLFDRRRGTVPKSDKDRRAITEQELVLARELGLRCLVFLSRAAREDREPELNDFLDTHVTEYHSGLWTRFYDGEPELRREIAAGLAFLRPRVVLDLSPGPEGLAARLYLRDVAPVWKKETVLGPVPVRPDPSASARPVLTAFRRGAETRSRLKDEAIRFLGLELGAAALPGALGEALAEVLDLAASVGRLVTLEVRTADPAALALPWELIGVPGHPLPVREGLMEVVRRIPPPGESDPLRDPAPTLPAGHLAVLGFTAAPLEDEAVEARVGTGGFAASELFWEREQESLLIALEGLLHENRGRLILPDTGEKEALRGYLSQADRPQVVHISCHGGIHQGEPALFLEDAEGHQAPLKADELLSWSRAEPGEVALLVLAACSTAGSAGDPGPDDEATGLAETLVRGGLLRVLGMQSTVSDAGATAFAEKFYARLADGADLSLALRAGRVELRARGLEHEWAIPTLTTRCDAGPLVAPKGSAEPVEHPFEAARGAFDIVGVSYLEEGYVGRREAERRLRHAFEEERLIAIHGLGGIGKSTLAARFLERRQTEAWRVLILYAGRELAPATVFEEVAAKLGLARPAGIPAEQADEQLRQAIKQELRQERTVLFLDNFEDNQDGDGKLKNAALGEALLALALLGGERFRLLFTSRYRVSLGPGSLKVRSLDLGGLSPSGCRKLRALPRFRELAKLPEEVWQRALFHFGGHPKALELLEGFLREQPDRARQMLAGMGPAVAAVDEDLKAEQQDKGRKLLVENVLATVPDERRQSFDRLCLLESPLPTEELEALLAAEGIVNPAADLGWLRDRGFLARTVAPSALTGGDAVHRLLASRRLEALAEREGAEAVRAWHLRVAEHLVERPGPLSDLGIAAWHRDAAGDRAGALGLYDRWAISLRNRHAYSACLQISRQGIDRFPIGDEESERAAVTNLLLRVHDALTPLGKVAEARTALDAALELLGEAQGKEARFSRASLRLRLGRALAQAGDTIQALSQLNAALADFEAGDHSKDRAVTLGDIARLRAQAGDVAGALKLHEERLQIFQKLGDSEGIANAQYELAGLDLKQGNATKALERLAESWDAVSGINHVQAIAVCGSFYGQLLAETDPSRALEILRTSRDAFQLLGMTADADELAEVIRKLENPEPAP